MPDNDVTPVGQQTPPQQVPDGYVEKARFDGLMLKVQELTLGKRDVDSTLSAKDQEIERLKVELGIKDAEKTTSITERDRKLAEMVEKDAATAKELDALRARALKVEVIKELKQPRLLAIIDDVPNMTDREALKTVLTNFAEFAVEAAKEREQQLLSGVTPPVGAGPTAPVAPTSDAGWTAYIEKLPLGSKEREKAFDDYYQWGVQTHK